MGIQFKAAAKLDHLDKINMFYARGRYTLFDNPVSDLATLYNKSCGLPDDYFRSGRRVLEVMLRTLWKLDLNEYRFTDIFLSLYSKGEPGLTMGALRSPTAEDAIKEILSSLTITQCNEKDDDGVFRDVIGLGKIEDNEELLEFIK